MKQYLFYTQHETDDANQPITALYISPSDLFTQKGLFADDYDDEDKQLIEHVCDTLGLTERAKWELVSHDVIPPQIIAWIGKPEQWQQFSTSNKFALACKNGAVR